ncbi:hypothetical protein AV530_006679 [Patagioenas fasciata monilis]|uniref:Uncharacterized protein n=1 Tax=Patagioenas fasciata monilis TaxID=372326 RepID=A0A1V4KPZ5_PATFA|nr:hypothetical protein AV530_006679 [Patagioenas fasciata monilis]
MGLQLLPVFGFQPCPKSIRALRKHHVCVRHRGSLPESAFSWQPKHAAGSPHSAARGTSLGCSSAFPKDALPVSALLRRCSPASDLLGTINQGLWLPGASRACDVRGELATPWEGHRDQQVKRLREMEGASTVTMFGQDLPIPPPEAQLQV